jgi:glutamine cyclotransferase
MNLTALFLSVLRYSGISYVCLSLIISCQRELKEKGEQGDNDLVPKKVFLLKTPLQDDIFHYDDTVHFTFKPLHEIVPDSVYTYLEGEPVHIEKTSCLAFNLKNVFRKVGRQNFRVIIFYCDSMSQTFSIRVTVLSDVVPRVLSYTKIRTIVHDQNDFTQGLVYYKNSLYEGTGREGFSSLKKNNPLTGKTELERKMDKSLFGEGITIINDNIFQLTYRQKVGFVYDIETFELIREFDLQTMEGWGLTTDGRNLIVSDGSSVLYFYDPEYFNQVKQLDVCNNKGLVTNLNELEYAEGAIWANVYGQPFIIKIDTQTGKVFARLNLESLFPKDMPRDYDHVLNGIAYNPDSKTFFVTGKLWPLMYEIRIE